MTDASLGERELDVMVALWSLGSGTVNEVRDRVGEPLAYTTILTILRNLEVKRFVRREEEGRAHRYFPLVERQTAQRSALSRLLGSFFEGSPQALIAQLVDDDGVSPEELKELAARLSNKAAKSKGATRKNP
ncbi:MAG: BlaI/MecI/CopY family transcriptional regulator [Gemmatimonadaceae bacterium]|nr:BlaI/MecI/CopY family transcriptional regulator [Gemmatimonadaceae bacterium]